MENVLRMMNVPTNSAMPAKARRKVSTKARPSSNSLASASACSLAVLTS
jgi:hypothetical protein